MNLNEVAPPGWGHTKAEKEKTKPDKPKSKIGGTAAAFKRALDDGRFKGLPGDKTKKEKTASMFKLMYSMKKKGAKPHYKPGTDEKYKKYQEEEVVLEKDLNAAERRALPNKDFALPGKGEGPEGKQRGAYPINDKKHARAALAMAAAHASPEKEAKVKAAVKKKYPGIEVQSEGVGTAVATGVKAAGKWAVRQGIKVGGKAGGKFVKKVGKEVGKEAVKAAGEVAVETGKGVVDAAKKRGRKAGEDFATNVGKKKEVDEAVVTGTALATAAVLGATGAGAEHVTKKALEKGDKKKEEKKVDEGVLQMVKSIAKKAKPQKTIRNPKMDSTTKKLHNWRKDREKEERRKYVSDFDPIDESSIDERTLSSYIPSDRQGEAHGANLDYVKAQLKKKEDESTKNRGNLSKRDAGKMAKQRLHNKRIMSMGEDKAFDFVKNKLKAKYGDGVLTKGDKMPELSAAQKKKNAEIRAKRAKEDHRDPTEKASDGRYSDRHSNRGSD